jgi:hypothetical protein
VSEVAINDPAAGVPIIRDTAALLKALTARRAELGLPDEFVAKLGGPTDAVDKCLGPKRMAVLDTLFELCAVSFVMVPDAEKMARMAERWERREAIPVPRRPRPFDMAAFAREGGKLRWRGMTKEQRSAAARHAVNARWAKRAG